MSSAKVIVFPLKASSPDSKLTWIGEGIAESLSGQLGGRGVKPMERSERTELVEALDLPPGAPLSQGSMIRVAQRASADLAVIGAFSGTVQSLRISVRVLDVKGLKLSGEMTANGPMSMLPQLENELAWMILTNMSLEAASSRERFRERIRTVPNSAYEIYIQSLSAADENDQLRLLLKAVEAYRNFPKAQLKIGYLYFQKGDYERAIPHLIAGCGEKVRVLDGEFMLGTCYLQKNQPIQAIRIYEQILQSARPLEVLNNMAIAHLLRGEYGLAVNLLVEAKALARADATVSLNLAIARHLQGNNSAALGVVEEAIKLHPKNGMLHFMLSDLLKTQGESEKAAAAANKARNLGINPDKIQLDEPKSWARPLLTWTAPKAF
jgi:Flp pilus assembly protein TadD